MKNILTCYTALFILCCALYLPGISSIPITDRDSAHFAQASRQMLQDHNYWTIRFQNTPRHLKPPGIYWLHTLSVRLLSSSTSNLVWPYTLVSVLGAMLAVCLTFVFTRQIYGSNVGFWAASLLAASPLLIIEAHLIVTDSTLLATIVLMQGALWRLYVTERQNLSTHWLWAGLFWLGMAFGILTKGISPLIALLTIVGVCFFDRNVRWLRCLRFYWGLPLVIGLTLLWLIPLSFATHSNFLLDMWLQDAWPKLIGGQQSHGMPPGYFTAIFILLFWPGALFIWQVIYWTWQNRQQASVRFLVAWIVPLWLFLEITPTKLPEYLLPTFPAIAILTALTINHREQIALPRILRWLAGLQCCVWVLAGIAIIDASMQLPYHFEKQIFLSSILVAIILTVTMILSIKSMWLQHLTRSVMFNIIGWCMAAMLILQFIVPQLHTIWVSEEIVAAIKSVPNQQINSTGPLLTLGYDEPSLVFLLGSDKVISTQTSNAVTQLQQKPIHLLLVTSNQVQELQLLAKPAGIILTPVKQIKGFNYSKGHWISLTLLTVDKPEKM